MIEDSGFGGTGGFFGGGGGGLGFINAAFLADPASVVLKDGDNFDAGSIQVEFVRATTPVPTPALLPGLVGMGIAAFRRRRQEADSTPAETTRSE